MCVLFVSELAAISLAGLTSYTMHLQVLSERKETKERGPPAGAEAAVTRSPAVIDLSISTQTCTHRHTHTLSFQRGKDGHGRTTQGPGEPFDSTVTAVCMCACGVFSEVCAIINQREELCCPEHRMKN